MHSGASFDDSLVVIDVIMFVSSPPSPYPVKHCRGFMLSITLEVEFSTVSEYKRVLV